MRSLYMAVAAFGAVCIGAGEVAIIAAAIVTVIIVMVAAVALRYRTPVQPVDSDEPRTEAQRIADALDRKQKATMRPMPNVRTDERTNG